MVCLGVMWSVDNQEQPVHWGLSDHEENILRMSYSHYCGERHERAWSGMEFTKEQTRMRDRTLQTVAVFP